MIKFPQVDSALVPPRDLVADGKGGLSSENWVQAGINFVRHFLIQRAALQPSDCVLDVGCGIGNKAIALASYLNSQGSYVGFDVLESSIEWCESAYKHYPNFNFQLVDVYSTHYNKDSQATSATFRFPYDDNSFDLVILASVFTHMLPDGVENYLQEISRVLRPGGRAVITYFLLNDEATAASQKGQVTYDLTHDIGSHGSKVGDPLVPEKMIGHREEYIRELYAKSGLTITDVSFGFWCGRKDNMKRLQDAIIAVK